MTNDNDKANRPNYTTIATYYPAYSSGVSLAETFATMGPTRPLESQRLIRIEPHYRAVSLTPSEARILAKSLEEWSNADERKRDGLEPGEVDHG